MSAINIKSCEELETFLRNTETVSGGDQYDFVFMVALLGACLDNLHTYALDAELEDIGDHLSEEQSSFLKRLQKYLDGDH